MSFFGTMVTTLGTSLLKKGVEKLVVDKLKDRAQEHIDDDSKTSQLVLSLIMDDRVDIKDRLIAQALNKVTDQVETMVQSKVEEFITVKFVDSDKFDGFIKILNTIETLSKTLSVVVERARLILVDIDTRV